MKEVALSLLKAAVAIFPPLLELLEHALDTAPDPLKPLADEIRAVLPVRSETQKALDELEAGKSNAP